MSLISEIASAGRKHGITHKAGGEEWPSHIAPACISRPWRGLSSSRRPAPAHRRSLWLPPVRPPHAHPTAHLLARLQATAGPVAQHTPNPTHIQATAGPAAQHTPNPTHIQATAGPAAQHTPNPTHIQATAGPAAQHTRQHDVLGAPAVMDVMRGALVLLWRDDLPQLVDQRVDAVPALLLNLQNGWRGGKGGGGCVRGCARARGWAAGWVGVWVARFGSAAQHIDAQDWARHQRRAVHRCMQGAPASATCWVARGISQQQRQGHIPGAAAARVHRHVGAAAGSAPGCG